MEYGDCGKKPFDFITARYKLLAVRLQEHLGLILRNQNRFTCETMVLHSPDKESQKTAKIVCAEVSYWSDSHKKRTVLRPEYSNELSFEKIIGSFYNEENYTQVLFLIRPFESDFLGKIFPQVKHTQLVFKQQATAYILYLDAQGIETMTWNAE